MRTKRGLVYLLAFVAALAVAFIARTLWYYPGVLRISENPLRTLGFYRPPVVAESTPVSIESLSGLSETTSIEGGEGRLVLIDTGHGNGFDEAELAVFAGRLAGSGARVAVVDNLESRLQEASGLLIIAPDQSFDPEEVQAIEAFVNKGGRVVIVGDPTRQGSVDAINTLTGAFGVIYQDAYVYNLSDNDAGFRNVSFTNFIGDNPITDGLSQVVFQTAFALRADEEASIITGDESTYTSGEETPGAVTVAALVGEGRVLTLPDFTFFTSPYNTFADNDLLLNNVAAFLLTGQRGFDLADFPFFFQDDTHIVYEDPVTLNATFEDTIALRERLTEVGAPASLSEEIDTEAPFIYVGLYDQASEEVLSMLEEAGVVISDDPLSEESDAPNSEGAIAIEGVARLEKADTVLLHLLAPASEESEEQNEAVYQLIILAADEDILSEGINSLLGDDLDACLVTRVTAVCRSGEFDSGGASGGPGGEDEEGEGGGVPGGGEGSFLVVSDDQGLLGSIGITSADSIEFALSELGFNATITSLNDDGVPTAEDMAEFDAVFWTTGDYCCEAPPEEALDQIMAYLDNGGRLFMDGLYVATDWSGTDFLNNYLGAEFDSFGMQLDMEVADSSHPLADGFEGLITFVAEAKDMQPDIIEPVGDADTVFVRGPDSEEPGAASVVALDAGDYRTAYASFPLFLLEENDLIQLIGNAVTWFLFD